MGKDDAYEAAIAKIEEFKTTITEIEESKTILRRKRSELVLEISRIDLLLGPATRKVSLGRPHSGVSQKTTVLQALRDEPCDANCLWEKVKVVYPTMSRPALSTLLSSLTRKGLIVHEGREGRYTYSLPR